MVYRSLWRYVENFNRKAFESHMEIAEFTTRILLQYLRVGNKYARTAREKISFTRSVCSFAISANVISAKFRCKQRRIARRKKNTLHR